MKAGQHLSYLLETVLKPCTERKSLNFDNR